MKLTLELSSEETQSLSVLIEEHLSKEHFGGVCVSIATIRKDDNGRYTVVISK